MLPPIRIGGRVSLAQTEPELRALLRSLIRRNIALMSARPGDYPSLTRTGVRYRREPRGIEEWQDADRLLRSGRGDCEDIAAYETARLILAGKRAQGWLKRVNGGYHVLCLVDGRPYDPSRELGMGSEAF